MIREGANTIGPNFERCVAVILREEGGYSDNPNDRGGQTQYGISQRAYPDVDIKALTPEKASAIYYRDFWKPMRCEDMPGDVALCVFDTAINCGVSAATLMLQEAVGVTADGLLGPHTLAAIRRLGSSALTRVCVRRVRRYHEIVDHRPGQRVFLDGWLHRTFRVYREAIRLEAV